MGKAKQKQQPMAQTSTQCSQTCLGMRDGQLFSEICPLSYNFSIFSLW